MVLAVHGSFIHVLTQVPDRVRGGVVEVDGIHDLVS